jgi:hypothetical protein
MPIAPDMIYDNDLKWQRRTCLAVLALNAGTGVVYAFRHEWTLVIAFLVWCVNILLWTRSVDQTQRTRDIARLSDAAVLKVLNADRS